MESQNVTCPLSFNCSGKSSKDLVSFDIGASPSYVSIVSCILSCLGSLLIVLAFCLLKDLRTTTQKIITFLAIADFISAVGYIFGSVNFLTHFGKTNSSECQVFLILCEAQATITAWSSLVSFFWTVFLALHFFLIIVFKRFHFAGKLLSVYNVIAWGVPLIIILPLLGTGKLGYAPYAASNWCYVKDYNYHGLRQNELTVVFILVAGKGWEFISYMCVTVLYLLIFCHIHRTRRQLQNTEIEPRMLQVEWRLMAIPMLFILLRMWGTIQLIVSLSLPSNKDAPCITPQLRDVYLALGILQAIGDGGQGWGNAVLYVFLSPTIRTRLFKSLCGPCVDAIEGRLVGELDTDTATSQKPGLNHRVRNMNVNKQDGSTSPLLPHRPATGYNIRKYDSTSSSEQSYNYEHSMSSTAA